jgi:hypothetical protein
MVIKRVYKRKCECGEPNIFTLYTDGKHVKTFSLHNCSCNRIPGPQSPPRRIPFGCALIEKEK